MDFTLWRPPAARKRDRPRSGRHSAAGRREPPSAPNFPAHRRGRRPGEDEEEDEEGGEGGLGARRHFSGLRRRGRAGCAGKGVGLAGRTSSPRNASGRLPALPPAGTAPAGTPPSPPLPPCRSPSGSPPGTGGAPRPRRQRGRAGSPRAGLGQRRAGAPRSAPGTGPARWPRTHLSASGTTSSRACRQGLPPVAYGSLFPLLEPFFPLTHLASTRRSYSDSAGLRALCPISALVSFPCF